MLPTDAVVFALQESASASHYARKPVVRWDLLRGDLDAAIASLTALGRTPVLLVEDWERAEISAKFPTSAIARLEWQPRAAVGADARVWLFDPTDRGKSPGAFVTDHVK